MRFILFLMLSYTATGQIGTGQWRLHVPARKAIDIVAGNGLVYTAFENGLLEYDPIANETSTLNAVNGLSDINLTCLTFDASRKTLYIGYENGNLDKLQDNRITNIPAIKLAQIPGSKKINKIVSYGNFIYLATGFSIVKIDPIKDEVKDTWYPTNGNDPILDLAFKNDTVFALTATRMFAGNIGNFALADPSEWIVDSRLITLTTTDNYKEIEFVGDDLFVLFNKVNYGEDSVFKIKTAGLELVNNETFSMEIFSISNQNEKLALQIAGGVFVYNTDYSYHLVANSYSFGGVPKPTASVVYDGNLWIADSEIGLVRYTNENSSTLISFEGPPKKAFYSMDWEAGKMAFASGGLSSIEATYNTGGVYVFEDEKWALFDKDNMPLWNNQNIWDFLTVSIDPTNTKRIAVGTYSQIPVSIIENNALVTDTFTPNNSPLEYTENGATSAMVTAVKYDTEGNLWVLNGYAENPLKALTKEGTWFSFDCGNAAKNKLSKKMVIDYNGNKWFAIENGGLFGYNDNNSISNPADDKKVNLNTNENTGALPSNTINALAVDFDNEIWIGTDNGFAILYNSANAFDAEPGEYNAQRIKLEYEGNVEYVLGNTNITDIEVDGGNRKWFGTANSGILLLSPDGQTILQQFTTENSPLISNVIIDLKLDQSTGELFIITDKGLVSYRTDASYEDSEYSTVTVFPNPAHPDFEGPITIQGIRYNSDVKITDIAGNLVYQTTSNGGTATWNGKTLSGQKVATGVYLIWTAANEGKGRKVGKVLVVH